MKDFYIASLFEVYGKLLTETQIDITNSYYMCDLSLGEIAEMRSISRQSVNDTLTKVKNQLLEYENTLGLYSKMQKLSEYLSQNVDSEKSKEIMQILEEK